MNSLLITASYITFRRSLQWGYQSHTVTVTRHTYEANGDIYDNSDINDYLTGIARAPGHEQTVGTEFPLEGTIHALSQFPRVQQVEIMNQKGVGRVIEVEDAKECQTVNNRKQLESIEKKLEQAIEKFKDLEEKVRTNVMDQCTKFANL